MKYKDFDLLLNEWGFYQVTPMPDENFLHLYYSQKYYQNENGNYRSSYPDIELEWLQLKARLVRTKVESLLPGRDTLRVLDVGCGEGWLMNEFAVSGYQVRGLDFSREGIQTFHPHLMEKLEQGDIYELLQQEILSEKSYDVVLLANVIEHVTDPVRLLQELKATLTPESVLVVTAPNDFSVLHSYLIEENLINEQWWVAYPDHLNYFNKESMLFLLSDLAFDVLAVVADNPIDLNLLNDSSNYIQDKEKGYPTHLFRVRMDNFLGSIDELGLLKLYECYGSMGVGRNLTYYMTIDTREK